MIRRSMFAVCAAVSVVLTCLVVASPAGAVIDTATVVPSPSPGTDYSTLNAVSCVGESSCVAVGGFVDGAGAHPMVANWDGTSWTYQANPIFTGDDLLSVSCASATQCMASNYSTTSAWSWDGSSWTQTPIAGHMIFRVFCMAWSSCTALGVHPIVVNGQFTFLTDVSVWDGGAWSRQSSPSPGQGPTTPDLAGVNNVLASESCVSASSCFAVGYYRDGGGVEQTLIAQWDGTVWTQVVSPNPGVNGNELLSVSCVNASWCTAVGVYDDGSGPKNLVLSWDGTSWSQMEAPNPGSTLARLIEVSCVTTSSCVAVGVYGESSSGTALVLVWDGNSWTRLETQSLGLGASSLNSVSCASESSCTAVGAYDDHGVGRTLVLSLTMAAPVPTTTVTTDPAPIAPAFTG